MKRILLISSLALTASLANAAPQEPALTTSDYVENPTYEGAWFVDVTGPIAPAAAAEVAPMEACVARGIDALDFADVASNGDEFLLVTPEVSACCVEASAPRTLLPLDFDDVASNGDEFLR